MNLKMTEGKKVKKALLVIDMQNVCVGKNHATSVTMLVSPEIMEAVRTEFCVKAAWWIPEKTKYRVRIVSTKNAICNWVINVTDHIIIESSSDKSIFDVLCNRATSIMNVYRLQAEM